jgi:hypothetical protein
MREREARRKPGGRIEGKREGEGTTTKEDGVV